METNEIMLGIIGMIMMYTWVHATAIVSKKLEKVTQYENVIIWIAFITWWFVLMGIIFK